MGRLNPHGVGATVSAQCDPEFVAAFDEWVAASDHSSRSAALRSLMAAAMDGSDTNDGGRVPPEEDHLATAWSTLKTLRSGDGWVREPYALNVLAQQHSMDERLCRQTLIRPLDDRGYLCRQAGLFGQEVAYRVYD